MASALVVSISTWELSPLCKLRTCGLARQELMITIRPFRGLVVLCALSLLAAALLPPFLSFSTAADMGTTSCEFGCERDTCPPCAPVGSHCVTCNQCGGLVSIAPNAPLVAQLFPLSPSLTVHASPPIRGVYRPPQSSAPLA